MQTMHIIQLQIVPDKVLLGNRDTLQTVGESMAQNNHTDINILVFQEMALTDTIAGHYKWLEFSFYRQKYASDHRTITYRAEMFSM